jgi:GNAT superfamily N-acetyltransferase
MTCRLLPPAEWPRLWAWMQDAPDCNLDDSSPSTEAAFIEELHRRIADGELIVGLYLPDHEAPVGAIGLKPVADGVWLHGLCIAPEWQRKGLGAALLAVMASTYGDVQASYYSDNAGIRRTFAKAGYQVRGHIHGQVTRHGEPVELEYVRTYARVGG